MFLSGLVRIYPSPGIVTIQNLIFSGSWDLPDYMSSATEERRVPRELMPTTDVDMSTR